MPQAADDLDLSLWLDGGEGLILILASDYDGGGGLRPDGGGRVKVIKISVLGLGRGGWVVDTYLEDLDMIFNHIF